MKLIDILVQELPKRGGWPEKAVCVVQDEDTQICFSAKTDGLFWTTTDWIGGDWDGSWINFFSNHLADDHSTSIVTREQYDAALAASKPEWDGDGLPPVGCEFLFGTHQTKANCIAVGRDVIFASTGNPNEKDGFYEEFVISIHHSEFRPIRSESDKKRDEAVKAMVSHKDDPVPDTESYYHAIYDAIAAGKIPHIRID